MNFNKKMNRVLEIFLVILMSVLVVDVLWQVISRYLLSSPSSFTDELAGYLLIWVGLLGAAYVAGREEHLAIDLLIQKSPPKRQTRLMVIIKVLIFLFALSVLTVGGIWLMYTRFVLEVKSAALQLPLGYVYIVLPLSGILIIYYSICQIADLIKKDK